MDAAGVSESRSATSALATASSAYDCAAMVYGGHLFIQDHSSGRGNLSLRGNYIFRGMMPLTMTPSPVQPLQPMPPEPSPASPVVQTLDKDDDEDIAEDQPMPTSTFHC